MPRSLKKGPFVASQVFKQVEEMNASGKKEIIQNLVPLNNNSSKYDWAYICCL